MWRQNKMFEWHPVKWSSSLPFPDAGGVQVGTDPEEGAEGEAGHDAALRPQAAQDPDQVPGPPVEKEQHEDHVGHLPEGPPPAQWRLGLRKRWENNSNCATFENLYRIT